MWVQSLIVSKSPPTSDNAPLTSEPTTSAEYFSRGLKSAQLGQPDAAAQDFEEAAWLDPENATIQFNLGTAYLSMGMFEQAVINLDRSLELDPDSSDALGNRAVARTALGSRRVGRQKTSNGPSSWEHRQTVFSPLSNTSNSDGNGRNSIVCRFESGCLGDDHR